MALFYFTVKNYEDSKTPPTYAHPQKVKDHEKSRKKEENPYEAVSIASSEANKEGLLTEEKAFRATFFGINPYDNIEDESEPEEEEDGRDNATPTAQDIPDNSNNSPK